MRLAAQTYTIDLAINATQATGPRLFLARLLLAAFGRLMNYRIHIEPVDPPAEARPDAVFDEWFDREFGPRLDVARCDGCDRAFRSKDDRNQTPDAKGYLCNACYDAHTADPGDHAAEELSLKTAFLKLPHDTAPAPARCRYCRRPILNTGTTNRDGDPCHTSCSHKNEWTDE